MNRKKELREKNDKENINEINYSYYHGEKK
jgi:hypothetical protein